MRCGNDVNYFPENQLNPLPPLSLTTSSDMCEYVNGPRYSEGGDNCCISFIQATPLQSKLQWFELRGSGWA